MTLSADQKNVLRGYCAMQASNGGMSGVIAAQQSFSSQTDTQITTLINSNVGVVLASYNKNVTQLSSQISALQSQLATVQSVVASCNNVIAVNAQIAASNPPT